MTWDVYAVRAPGTRRLEDLPERFVPPAVGSADAVLDLVRQAAPAVDASDPSWLVIQGPDASMEVALGKGAQVHDVTFYIRSGDGSVPVVLDLCRRIGVTPYDTETGERLTASSTFPAPPEPEDDEDGGEGPRRRWWRRGGGD